MVAGAEKSEKHSGAAAQVCYHRAMREPSLRASRLAIAGGLIAAIAIGTGGFLAGRSTVPRRAPVPAAVPSPVESPPSPEPPGVLRRADIAAFADRAADAFSSGAPLPEDMRGLAGRRFEIVLPFGCSGPAATTSAAPLRWFYDAAQERLRIDVSATQWDLADWGLAGDGEQTAQGFWISRPWSSAETCAGVSNPVAVSDAEPVTLTGQTLGIAQFGSLPGAGSDAAGPRSFNTVKRIAPSELDASRGFGVTLSGRIARFPGGAPVRCRQPGGSEQRPICLVAASFEEVTLQALGSGEALATWALAAGAER